MTAIADSNGKIWIAIDQGDVHATFAIGGDGGVAFVPGQEVTIDDTRIVRVTEMLLASLGAARVPITETA